MGKRLRPDEEVGAINTLTALRGDPYAMALLRLVEHNREGLRDRLEACTAEDFLYVQGELRAWKKVLKYLTGIPLITQEK